MTQRSNFVGIFNKKKDQTNKVMLDIFNFDKENRHWAGKILGISVENIMFYGKVSLGIFSISFLIYGCAIGYHWMASFPTMTIIKFGYVCGLLTAVAFKYLLSIIHLHYYISPNAVYNQSIALVLKNEEVSKFIGLNPCTGTFKAYCNSGGVKFPTLRRLRAGNYTLSDLFGTKPRKLQMMFLIKGSKNVQGLVSCEVEKARSLNFNSAYQFNSLSIHMNNTNESKSVIIVGTAKDIIYSGLK